jgi:uncharacterized protein (DUF1684 family)
MGRKSTVALAAIFAVSASFAGATPAVNAPPSAPDAAYQQDYGKWKADVAENLKQNWLPLAGLFWLKLGENSFGSGEDNSLVFPKGPAHAGVFELQGKDVTMRLATDAHAIIAGKPITSAKLVPDNAENTTLVGLGSLRFHVIVRGERIGIRVKDVESAAVETFRGLTFYPLDLNFRVTARWEPSDGKKTVNVPNILGDVTTTPLTGTAVFKINGQEIRLTDLGEDPSKGLFFVFNDLTSKTDTYPGGRFLDTEPVVNGTVVLDFNRAYNPPCAVTPYATCPLAPKENRLSVAVPVGEKYDRAHAHH